MASCSQQITCSKIENSADLPSCSLECQLGRRAFLESTSSDRKRCYANKSRLFRRTRKNKPRCSKYVARNPDCGHNDKRKEESYKCGKCEEQTCFSQRDRNADGHQRSAHGQCYLNALACGSQPIWSDSAHRNFVRYKGSVFSLGQSSAGVMAAQRDEFPLL